MEVTVDSVNIYIYEYVAAEDEDAEDTYTLIKSATISDFGEVSPYSYCVDGLTPDTTYYYEIKVNKSSSYGSEFSVDTSGYFTTASDNETETTS